MFCKDDIMIILIHDALEYEDSIIQTILNDFCYFGFDIENNYAGGPTLSYITWKYRDNGDCEFNYRIGSCWKTVVHSKSWLEKAC